MGTASIEYEWRDAKLLAWPSFAYPLLEVESDRMIRKELGFCRGLVLHFLNGKVIAHHDNEVCLEYARIMLDPEHYADPSVLKGVREPLASVAYELFMFYRGFTVLSSPLDDVELFASIAASRYTQFHANTVKWIRAMLDYFKILEKVAWSDDKELLLVTASRSYQLMTLPEAMRHYLTIRFEILEETNWRRVRRALMYVKGIGPKIADAYLLFVKRIRSAAPADRNLMKLLERVGIKGLRYPDKKLCMRYSCEECPLRDRCLRNFVYENLGEYAGLFQTIVYVHTDFFCEQKRCNMCPIRAFCSAYAQR